MGAKRVFSTIGIAILSVGAFAQEIDLNLDASSRVTDLSQNPNAENDIHQTTINSAPQFLGPNTESSSVVFGPGSASSWVTANMGVFHAFATSAYTPTNSNEYSTAQASAIANDSEVVTSATLAAGTMTTVHFKFVIDGTISDPSVLQDEYTDAYAAATLTVESPTGGSAGNFFGEKVLEDSGTTTITADVAAEVGATVTFNYELEASTYTHAEAPSVHSATADFSNTAQLFITSDPGVTLTSGSGYDYAPVPEPVPTALLGLGALGLLLRKRS